MRIPGLSRKVVLDEDQVARYLGYIRSSFVEDHTLLAIDRVEIYGGVVEGHRAVRREDCSNHDERGRRVLGERVALEAAHQTLATWLVHVCAKARRGIYARWFAHLTSGPDVVVWSRGASPSCQLEGCAYPEDRLTCVLEKRRNLRVVFKESWLSVHVSQCTLAVGKRSIGCISDLVLEGWLKPAAS